MSGLISMNGGASFTPFQAPANVTVQLNSRSDLDTGSTRFFDTEMLSLNLSGGTLPGGIMVRESPTKASLGRTSVRTIASDGTYRISSFFDIFTELSLDGGQTWSPSVVFAGEVHLGTSQPRPQVSITRSGANVIISWPSPSTGFVLEQNGNVANPNGWSGFGGTVNDNGQVKSVTVSALTGNVFYRLRK
jgi:hypothetical protein